MQIDDMVKLMYSGQPCNKRTCLSVVRLRIRALKKKEQPG